MTLKQFILPFFLLLCHTLVAQQDSIVQLKEVVISDTQLRDFSGTQSVQKLNDSVIGRNAASLTSLLQYNTVIYFKENGLGMVSSPSFRGSTAQQTAVIWNGININSQFNGQTDFNTLNTRDFNVISVRVGGGSVIYGSSAIGGSIHLDNELAFDNKFTNELRTDYGSYNTLGVNYKVATATNRFSTNVSISHNSSDNDYKFPGYNVRNDNGQYKNTSLNAAFAYRLNAKNVLRLYSYLFNGERHFARTISAPSRSLYDDTNTRNLLEWTGNYNRFTSRLKVAYLQEKYKYFEDFATDSFTFGQVKTFISRYDATYDFSSKLKLNAIADYTQNNGEGSDILNHKRNVGSGSLLMKHAPTERFQYELGIRKEIKNAYQSPLLFSAGANVGVAKFYSLKVNASRNFRIPTYNDLYWQGSGNPNLKPESSYQAEVGNVFSYAGATLSVTGYYIKLRDMLRWVPDSGNIWRPENVGKVSTYGVESVLSYQKQFGHSRVTFNGTYAYTVSREDGSSNQLMYVPKHKATAALAYAYKNISVYYRHLFTGEVFYTTDSSAGIDPYNVSAIGAEYTFKVLKGCSLGAQVSNLYNTEYLNVASRPMPGRNYNVYLNLKF
ncbi:TonB-dependent receptor [Flavobacterium rivuli WB 3.3-2 = DSM 21788]|uniref:TonB-dependent receptor n=1 Tax=Flavobacterium rivuli WB 3.3-2 = DSM 21788 TaxID=1121895 RepID=A0A0A2M8D1_9FLAO|nr:TonB-dependent receptor [Flavobacterium rivuli]KGO87663.1 TonB-dependent receptor [Flavobacterium rivuli WB 3.3-2 = DSM 21788]